MRNLIREGLEGRTIKATFLFYLGSLIVLAPAAILIWLVFGYENLLFATPFLVIVLVGLTYAYCYFNQVAALMRKPRLNVRTRVVKFPDTSHREVTPESH